MFAYVIMNSKERKKILKKLEGQFDCDTKFLKEYAFLFKESDGRVHICNADVAEELSKRELRVDSAGLYIATLLSNGELRLSIEGSQLLGPHSKKNILEITDGEFGKWIRGNAIEKETDLKGFVILKRGVDFCGCGKPVRDEKTGKISIHNYIPKTRYVRSEE
jgi:NOL1/NOP2/fmu family ribosome biogenesis protein